jgi:hypothetical protein
LKRSPPFFQRSQGAPVVIDGRLVQPIFQDKIVGTKSRFVIRRVKSTNSPVQGLRLKAVKGRIQVNGQSHSEVILWADTSPASVKISVSWRPPIGSALSGRYDPSNPLSTRNGASCSQPAQGVSSIASHTLAKRFLLIGLAPSTNPGNAARPGRAAALERPAGDACAIPKNRGSIPHPDGG